METEKSAVEVCGKALSSNQRDDWTRALQAIEQLAGSGAEAGNLDVVYLREAAAWMALDNYVNAAQFVDSASRLAPTAKQLEESCRISDRRQFARIIIAAW